MKLLSFFQNMFKRNYQHYEGVYHINVYRLMLRYFLMLSSLAYGSWNYILTRKWEWNQTEAAVCCTWGAYSLISCSVFFDR